MHSHIIITVWFPVPLSALYTSAHKYLQPPIRFHCHYPPPVPPTFTPISHFANFPRYSIHLFLLVRESDGRRVLVVEQEQSSNAVESLFNPVLLYSDPHLLSETSFTGPFTPWIWGQQAVKSNIINIRAGYDWWHGPVRLMRIQN